MSLPTILRLGLRQLAAGMLSVLALGILNRVMKVEMGLGLGLVSLVIGAHYFAAPLSIPLGHRSDRRPYFGLHRTPYIVAGTAVTVVATALAPFVAFLIEGQDGSPLAAAVGVLLFLVMGAGMYTAGTAYLSLLTDLTQEAERGKVVSIIWSMMMVGILAGVFLGVQVMGHYRPSALVALFLMTAGIVALCTAVAIWGVERRGSEAKPSEEAQSLPQAMGILVGSRQAQLFFGFLFCGIFFLFLQQTALEPFGGDVFGMSVRETTLFNAFQMVGVLLGMGVAGAWLSKRMGPQPTAGLGALGAAASFALLTVASAGYQVMLVRPAIFLMGLGMGIFNVGALSLMMGLTAAGRVGLFMGAWTLAQALANGLSALGGGLIHDLGLAVAGQEGLAYAAVFGVEAGGLGLTLLLMARLSLAEFRAEVAGVAVA